MPGVNIHAMQVKFENYVTMTASRKTAQRYSKALEDFLGRFRDKKSPTDFTRADVEDYIIQRRRDGLSPRTINYNLQIARAFWNYMIDLEVTPWNPFSKVKRLKETEPERHSLSIPQQEQLYKSVAAHGSLQDRILVGLALSTGLRAETLVQLEKSDVDFNSSALRIPATKMKAARNHDMPLIDWLLKLLEQCPDGRIFEGYARNAAALSARYNRLCQRAGIPLRGLRTARRTFGTTLIRSGVDIRTVKDLMAHRNIATTSRYLTPADEETTRKAIENLPVPSLE